MEQYATVLHAGSVAEQLLWPGSTGTFATSDHDQLHEEMHKVEDDGSVHITWCNYLWQRTYTLLEWPGQWKLIVAVARELQTHRTLDGRATELYLKLVDRILKYDGSMPNSKLIETEELGPAHFRARRSCGPRQPLRGPFVLLNESPAPPWATQAL